MLLYLLTKNNVIIFDNNIRDPSFNLRPNTIYHTFIQ